MTDTNPPDPMTAVLPMFRLPEMTGFDDAWVGMEPTFQTKKSVNLWAKLSATEEGEDEYFKNDYMLQTQKDVAKAIQKKYRQWRDKSHPFCMFEKVERHADLDQWRVRRQNLLFHWADRGLEPFEVRFSIDPETFEYSIKPVPLAWFYDARFVGFLEEFLWRTPMDMGLQPSIAHGGAQFSFSAKSFLGGSLLADVIASRLNHPELAIWVMDQPNCDDRSFRATRRRYQAFRDMLEQYWRGAFHPRAIGTLTVENAYTDRGFEPAANPAKGLVEPGKGPVGSPDEIFQTNFAFGRALRLRAQDVHPGYWQAAHPLEEGYRPDQIMRYSEGNLNRLQIAGELHVKSGKVLNPDRVVELDTPLTMRLLYEECSWEIRAQMGRTSARDFVEALLLDVHHAKYLQQHPHEHVVESLLQDQVLMDGERVLEKHAPKNVLEQLRSEARTANLDMSRQRIKSDWIEPENLVFPAWGALPIKERAAIAREVVNRFTEYVQKAASVDLRPETSGDPMEWHRHRIHPSIWTALEAEPSVLDKHDTACAQLSKWQLRRADYLARRPVYSVAGVKPPWDNLE